jgi:predicted nuclease with TOPRIM domain
MVYVDNFNVPYKNMVMCHLVADTQAELFIMVDKIGVQRKWIQYYGDCREHFDISLVKKQLAIKNGAIEVGMRKLARMTIERDYEVYAKWNERYFKEVCESLTFEGWPETEEQLKEFEEKFKDYPCLLDENEIDPTKILNSLKSE